ncbi:bifunctional phosphoglucose/phosphomannose isomerase [Candidatus Bathyarchaeota archaeon]|nr:bifunctional phosphoglucose/phosphomannose isomerase [Candidatus Bathyarchaeota archaeon]
MPHNLDDLEYIRKLDSKGMLDVVHKFPENCLDAISTAERNDLGLLTGKYFKNVIIVGMGGSAVGGLLIRDWLKFTCKIPFIVLRDYTLPEFVAEDTLILAVSYSGNTEETISALLEGLKRKSSIITFCSGGKMEQIAKEYNLLLFKLPQGYQPRAAMPYQFFAVAVVLKKLGLINDLWREVEEAIAIVTSLRKELQPETPLKDNISKLLALELRDYIPLIYGSSIHEAVAYRFNTQFNENGKSPAGTNFFPEAFHNSVMAGEGRRELLKHLCALIIHDPLEDPDIAAKITRFIRILESKFAKVVEVEARGNGRLARILSALYIGDYTSIYLGVLYGKDPSSTDSIDILKKG